MLINYKLGEIMLSILRILVLHSVSTIPYFALACKKFFLLSRDPSIWQYACIRVFREPSMTLEQSKRIQSNYVQKYDGHWMRMFIDRPRIRYDGIYISTCNYIRPGASDTAWEKPIHFVTYYRYIRFFPDGTVLKHVTTNEPKHVVKSLEMGFNKKQCFYGRFLLDDDDHIKIVMKDKTLPKETFNLTLKIKTTHRGRHNKLNWNSYFNKSDLPNRIDHEIDLKTLKAFFFSPVRSYNVYYPNELDDTALDNEILMTM
jgi:F-box protein 9